MTSCDNVTNKNIDTTNVDNKTQPKEDFGNKNLYVKGLWKDCTQVELDDLFKRYGSIAQSRVYGNGVGFVRYQEGKQAHAAILGLNDTKPNAKCMQPLIVKYANKKIRQPKSNEDNSSVEMFVSENTKNIYLRFLPSNYNESELYQLCSKFGQITCIRLCKKGFAFVRFLSGKSASLCIGELNGKLLPGGSKPLMVKFANSDPFEPRIGFRSPYLPQYFQQHGGVNFHLGLQNNYSNPLPFGGQEIKNTNISNLRNDVSPNGIPSIPLTSLSKSISNDIHNLSINNNSSTSSEWNPPLPLGNNISNNSNISDISQVSSINSSSSSSMWPLNSAYSYCSIPLNGYNYSYNSQSIPLYSNFLNPSHPSLIQQPSPMISVPGGNIFSIPSTSSTINIPNHGVNVQFQPMINKTTNFNLSSLHPETVQSAITPSALNDNSTSVQVPFSSLSISGGISNS